MKPIAEICCGSYYDGLQASRGGAGRIELNHALSLGGLTPSLSELSLLKQETDLSIISMLRPRGGGFCYSEEEYKALCLDCNRLLDNGSDGVAFGFLKEDGTVDCARTETIARLIKQAGREAVFHRAFDCTPDAFEAVRLLIELGIDRILTSGQQPTAPQGAALIAALQKEFGSRIEFLPGSGVRTSNAKKLLEDTGTHQVHSSCKCWIKDSTTVRGNISYAYASGENLECYEAVSADEVSNFIKSIS